MRTRSATRGDLGLAPDERGDLARQVAGERVERAQRWELGDQARSGDLEDALEVGEVAQAVLTEVDELDRTVAHERARGERDDDLAAVRDAHQPRGRFTSLPK